MYQRIGNAAYKADLDITLRLASYLEHPENTFKSIHVAGTNGKGSTSHMLASILQEAGYKVGLYTSPHLKDFRERIKINGEMIPKRFVSSFVTKHKPFFETNQLSFFEMTVGLAFDYFRKEKVDIAVIEVGMGGRLDSTNIITPEVAIITNIGKDHTQFLGTSLAEIAAEKAGIMKKDVPVVIGTHHDETAPVFLEISEKIGAPLHTAYDFGVVPLASDLKGNYQSKNIKTVQKTVWLLQNKGYAIGIQHLAKGLMNVVKNTGLLGRWQVLQENPRAICDTAHNSDGLTLVLQQVVSQRYDSLHIVLGVVSDKDLAAILPLFPKNATYYFCKPNVPRGMEVAVLAAEAATYDLKGASFTSVKEAYEAALQKAENKDLIFVGGSTFVVAEVL